MRKRNKGRKLSRPKNQREALLKSQASSLFLHGKIKTTEAKAKELRVVADKLITKAMNSSMYSKRLLSKALSDQVIKKLVNEITPGYSQRQGGYTKIVKLGPRKSDGAKMAIIELIK